MITIMYKIYKWLLKVSARAVFNHIDTNRDGKISKKEAKKFLEEIMKYTNGDFKKLKL